MTSPPILSREEIHSLIEKDKRVIVLYGKHVLDLSAWIHKHPGGPLVIQHCIGKECRDEIDAYHAYIPVRTYTIGEYTGQWENMIPPLQVGGVYDDKEEGYPAPTPTLQENIRKEYRDLHAQIKKEGLYKPVYKYYLRNELPRYLFLLGLCAYALVHKYYLTAAFFNGLFWHQVTFTAHDAAHKGITGDWQKDTTIGILIANLIGGISIGWWKKNHNTHHIVTNSVEHDPDIQHLPFLAVNAKLLNSIKSTYYDRILEYDAFAKSMVKFQQWTFYPLMCLGRFNLYRLSLEYLFLQTPPDHALVKRFRRYEIAAILMFWLWYGVGLIWFGLPDMKTRILYVLISHAVTAPLHIQITLSHFASSTKDLGVNESFAQRQLRTTMDIYTPPYLDFIHGGLQFQAVHHLFPRIPRHNLRKTQDRIRSFSEKVGIEYRVLGFVKSNFKVMDVFGEVSKQARIMAKCAKSMAEKGDLNFALD